MIRGEIVADRLDADQDNRATLARIRSFVGRCDDGIPFLLLPVRIETRFTRVYRSHVGGSAPMAPSELLAVVGEISGDLRKLARCKLATSFDRGRPKREVKRHERSLYRKVDGIVASIRARWDAIRDAVDKVQPPRADDRSRLQAHIDNVRKRLDHATTNLGTFRSAYQSDVYVQRMQALRREVVAPMLESLEERVLPWWRWAEELEITEGRALDRALAKVDLTIPRVPRGGFADADELRSATRHLPRTVAALARALQRPLRTDTESLGASRQTARSIDARMTGLREAMEAVPTPTPVERRRVAEVRHGTVDAFRDAVSTLMNKNVAHTRCISPGILADAAACHHALRSRVDQLRRRHSEVSSDQPAADMALAGGLHDAIPGLTGLARQIPVAPRIALAELRESMDGLIQSATIAAARLQQATPGELHTVAELECARRLLLDDIRWIEQAAVRIRPDGWSEDDPGAGAWGRVLVLCEPGDSRAVDELWVRVFPDAIHVDTHEPPLTAAEASSGREFWRQTLASHGDDRLVKGAWRALCALHGVARSAWIARSIEPREVRSGRRPGLHEFATPDGRRYRFPDVDSRQGEWSRAPRAGALPDRFVVLTVNDGRITHTVVGGRVDPELKVGLDPDPDDPETELFRLDDDGDLVVGASIRWMTDFQAACECGMGIVLPITPDEAREGFDEVIVVGVREEDAETARRTLEALFDAHHYTDGLALVPIGTPTNNTDEEPAGYSAADSADESFAVERGHPLVGIPAGAERPESDGARLAYALGIDPQLFAHVAHADGSDGVEADWVHEALWPATVGAHVEDHLAGVLALDSQRRLADFAIPHVRARGPLATIRVGAQPYGMLPALALSRFQPDGGRAFPPLSDDVSPPRSDGDLQTRFDHLLAGVLEVALNSWNEATARVKHAHSRAVDDPAQHFVEMLGLHATSVTHRFRFAVNGWGSFSGRSLGSGLAESAQRAPHGPSRLWLDLDPLICRALGIEDVNDIPDALGQKRKAIADRIWESRAFRLDPMAESHGMFGPVVGDGHEQWLPELAHASALDLSVESWDEESSPRSLLYLLARHARLVAYRSAARDILLQTGIIDEKKWHDADANNAFKISTLRGVEYLTRWSFLFQSLPDLQLPAWLEFEGAGQVLRAFLGTNSLSTLLADSGNNDTFASLPSRGKFRREIHDLQRHAQLLEKLTEVPEHNLVRLVREHLDLASYRLDAWITALAQRRLTRQRRTAYRSTPRPLPGAHLGAYGWVGPLRPAAARQPVGDLPPGLDGVRETVHGDAHNQGFVQAPSLQHAVTAAILRSGYLSEQGLAEDNDPMAINLTSARVRRALVLLQGVREGHDVEALLGVQFERGLHDAAEIRGVELDELILPLRRAFPSVMAADPDDVSDRRRERQVVDGLGLLKAVEAHLGERGVTRRSGTLYALMRGDGTYPHYPWGLQQGDRSLLPPLLPAGHTDRQREQQRLEAVLAEIDRVADSIDALGDLAVAEGVFQIAGGNHDRAAAVLESVSAGYAMPAPTVATIPRSGLTLTQRVILPLPVVDGSLLTPLRVGDPDRLAANRRDGLPRGWRDVPWTPRALVEPSLNRWLGELLGPAQSIGCMVTDRADPEARPRQVSVVDLQLQPLDLLALLGQGMEVAEGELNARVVAAVDLSSPLGDAAPPGADPRLHVRYSQEDGDPHASSFLDVVPLLTAVQRLLAHAHPMDATDLEPPRTEENADLDEERFVDQELEFRVRELRARFEEAGDQLVKTLDSNASLADLAGIEPRTWLRDREERLAWHLQTPARTYTLAEQLRAIADFGVPEAIPPFPDVSPRAWLDRTRAALAAALERTRAADAAWASRGDAEYPSSVYLATARAVFGGRCWILPLVHPRDRSELTRAIDGSGIDDRDADGVMDEWLFGVSRTREAVAELETITLLADTMDRPLAAPRPAQLPYVAGETWSGAPFDADAAPAGDRLSLVVWGPEYLRDDGDPIVGLVVDEWNEMLPSQQETTGIAFHHEQPDATAPHALLLAVTPEETGQWSWDDLVHTVHETMELARVRAVEPDHLHDTPWARLLPAITGELIPDRHRGGERHPERHVILEFYDNNRHGSHG